ncbi:transcriptional repressor [Silvanigrella paludirubra]|jgi:Fur family iron response transcriptional regulator|uniref:Transcriptional repressor n=1 Tax=Silvanigrella paludirubra TaxID=2499159 RepID=A0A6N6VTF4_9BACT|nr:Fur family transcriptional regulator [Silvanigrella paludirubra]KAB8039453.1 transcriptional repressor [Silvanigrella paludirubra]
MILKINKEKAHCLTVPEIEERLKKSGVAATAQRIAICKFVLCEADHPTAEDIKNWTDANFPKLSRATVYNTLDVLVQAGMLKELKLPHTGKVVYDTNVGDHYHFLDSASGKLFDISNEECKVILNLPKDIYIEEVDVFLRGKVSSV